MATTISSGTNPYKLGSPPDFGTLYSGRALEFDGVTDYVDNGVANFRSSDSLGTVSMWFNIDTTGINHKLLNSADTGTDTSTIGLGINASNQLAWYQRNAADTGDSITGGTTLVASRWYHVAVVSDGSAYTIYLDGVAETLTVASGANNGDWFADTTLRDNFVIGALIRTGTENYFDGKLTNVQIWDKAWSLSDVQYAYTHPEKLITHNSAVTSGTTISNLKAWYPCTEGAPRSPQTLIYDGSPKELGSDLVTNGTFDTDSSWNNTGSNGWSINTTTKKLVASNVVSYDFVSQDVGITINGVFLITFDATVDSGEFVVTSTADIQTITSSNSYTLYFTGAYNENGYIYFKGNGFTGTIDNVSVKEVQMGNHGTTTFYGDDLQDATWNDNDYVGFASASADGFTVVNANAAVGNDDNAYGKQITFTSGRTYQIDFDVTPNSSVAVPQIWFGIGSATTGQADTTQSSNSESVGETAGTHSETFSFTPSSTLTDYYPYIRNGANAAYNFTVTNYQLKEVGVAGGWTTADAEPLIPQTALMGMSKPMVFDGIDDVVNIDGVVSDVASDTAGTWSIWVSMEDATPSAEMYVLTMGDTSADEFILFSIDTDGDFRVILRDGGADQWEVKTDSPAFSNATWHHVVLVQDGTSPVLYVNGAKPAQTFSTTTDKTAWMADCSGLDNCRIGTLIKGGGSGSGWFLGYVNEVSIWNDDLSLAEVQELFNDGVALDATAHSKEANLKGYWRNDGASSWSDRQDNVTANNGTPAGSPDTILLPEGTTTGKDILGFPLTHTNNGWLNLDGVDNIVIVKDNDTLDFGTGSFTVEFWSKSDESTVSNRYIVQKYYNGWAIYGDNNNQFRVRLKDAGSEIYPYVASSGVQDPTWHHWVMILDRSDHLCKVYKDSVRQTVAASDISTVPNVDSGNNLLIGGKNGTNYNWHGSLDEVRIYNRALTAYESDGTEPEVGETAVSGEVLKNYKHGLSKHS
jgi:hypothetical protein